MVPVLAFSALLLLFSHAASGAELSEDDGWSDGISSDTELYGDPWEETNKSIFDFNITVDSNIIRPISNTYGKLPDNFRYAANNVLTNLSEPANIAHGILQFDPKMALTSFWRFALNTTIGLVGIRDFASEQGLTHQNQSFTNTLNVWGISAGPYVVIPVFGPSSVRGTAGMVADFATDPFTLIAGTPAGIVRGGADAVNERHRKDAIVNDLYYESLDPYGKTRSAYRQNESFADKKQEKIFGE